MVMCDTRATDRYYGKKLSSCGDVDAAITCGSTGICSALDRNDKAQYRSVDSTRCIYRPEGGRPGLLCDAVDQWPSFEFGELRTWEDECYSAFACNPKNQSSFLRMQAVASSTNDLSACSSATSA